MINELPFKRLLIVRKKKKQKFIKHAQNDDFNYYFRIQLYFIMNLTFVKPNDYKN